MVLTNAQTTAFFESAAQMGIPRATVTQLAQEGITTVGDLADFDKDAFQQVSDSL
jgi:predicted RecB family nuclease